MSVLSWIQTVWQSDSVPERIIWKVNFKKKSADDNKSMKHYHACKALSTQFAILGDAEITQ